MNSFAGKPTAFSTTWPQQQSIPAFNQIGFEAETKAQWAETSGFITITVSGCCLCVRDMGVPETRECKSSAWDNVIKKKNPN